MCYMEKNIDTVRKGSGMGLQVSHEPYRPKQQHSQGIMKLANRGRFRQTSTPCSQVPGLSTLNPKTLEP